MYLFMHACIHAFIHAFLYALPNTRFWSVDFDYARSVVHNIMRGIMHGIMRGLFLASERHVSGMAWQHGGGTLEDLGE